VATVADHDDDATPDTPSDEPGPVPEPEAGAAPDDTVEGEVVADDETRAEPDVVDRGDSDGDDGETGDEGEAVGGRPGWVVPFLLGVVAVVAVVLGVVALAGGDDDDPAEDDDAAAEEAADDGADTTVGTAVPPVTTAPGTPTAGLLSELEPVDSETWEPADADVTIGGAAHAETVVSGPIGTCDDGDAQTVTYDLAGGYTWLEGVVGLVDGTETGLTVEIGFEADGEEVGPARRHGRPGADGHRRRPVPRHRRRRGLRPGRLRRPDPPVGQRAGVQATGPATPAGERDMRGM
jgi:hypothetical protein